MARHDDLVRPYAFPLNGGDLELCWLALSQGGTYNPAKDVSFSGSTGSTVFRWVADSGYV